jgi:hypothetical protein
MFTMQSSLLAYTLAMQRMVSAYIQIIPFKVHYTTTFLQWYVDLLIIICIEN